MIKTGTTFFNDMYWFWRGTARAVLEMGIRAAISAVFIDFFDKKKAREQTEINMKLFEESGKFGNRITFTLGPHAIYTVSEESLKYLEKIGFLGPNVIACHGVYLNQKEILLLKRHDVKVVHNPISNMKLAVGKAFPYERLKTAGITISLGTDGCSSNNNLDMLESMKFASPLPSSISKDPN
jgi:5-methylthioadenosine/S-adenosylhomocysteine deaminase